MPPVIITPIRFYVPIACKLIGTQAFSLYREHKVELGLIIFIKKILLYKHKLNQ